MVYFVWKVQGVAVNKNKVFKTKHKQIILYEKLAVKFG